MPSITLYEDGSTSCKILDPTKATSIICNKRLLDNCKDLSLVGRNRDNAIYHVHDTEICIMHVECSFCILVDNIVDDDIIIPQKLRENHYGVYQSPNGRDWIKNTRTGELIGYELKRFISKLSNNPDDELDHWAETFNELDKSKRFILSVFNAGTSHRRRINIENNMDLYWLINRIRFIDQASGGTFLV